MTEIQLSNCDLVALVDDEDYEIVRRRTWRLSTESTGRRDAVVASNRYRKFRLHRVILGIQDPSVKVDHINGDVLDNRRSNLRVATNAQNMANVSRYKTNTSGYRGVTWSKAARKWQAQVQGKGAPGVVGWFLKAEDAARAYDAAARAHFGEYGRYNFPREGELKA